MFFSFWSFLLFIPFLWRKVVRVRVPAPTKEIIKRSYAGYITWFKTADNSIQRTVFKKFFKSMESRYDLSILDGRRGGGPYLEKVSSSNSSVLERSRCQSLMMIFQVFLEMENGSEMY